MQPLIHSIELSQGFVCSSKFDSNSSVGSMEHHRLSFLWLVQHWPPCFKRKE